jgi:hypothetical protein
MSLARYLRQQPVRYAVDPLHAQAMRNFLHLHEVIGGLPQMFLDVQPSLAGHPLQDDILHGYSHTMHSGDPTDLAMLLDRMEESGQFGGQEHTAGGGLNHGLRNILYQMQAMQGHDIGRYHDAAFNHPRNARAIYRDTAPLRTPMRHVVGSVANRLRGGEHAAMAHDLLTQRTGATGGSPASIIRLYHLLHHLRNGPLRTDPGGHAEATDARNYASIFADTADQHLAPIR